MAFGKGRASKRNSSSSYASTITMVIFVALCVIGVWMLSSNSSIPQPISRASTQTVVSETERNDISASSNGNSESEEQPAFEDNPGRLPDDAIKSEDEQQKLSKEKNERMSIKAGVEGGGRQSQMETQKQESQQNDEKIPEEKEKDNYKENKMTVQENDEGKLKQVVKEFEKEQKEQRDEDSGSQSSNTKEAQEQEQRQGKESHEVEQGKKQVQDGNGEVTYTDATKEEQPMEVAQSDTSENSKNEENGQQQGEQNSGNEENGQQDEEKNTIREEKSTNNENGQQDEHNTTDDESGSKEEHNTLKDENVEQQEEEQKDEKTQDSSEASGFGSGIPKESAESQKSWKSQATESKDEKERQTSESNNDAESMMGGKTWVLCNTTAGPDYIPCLDNEEAISKLKSRRHFEHRERHCPEDPPTCLVSLPEGYKESIKWPESRDKVKYYIQVNFSF